MARDVFFRHPEFEGAIFYDADQFGACESGVTPFTISIYAKTAPTKDEGRAVGYEGDGQVIIGMHGLRPDPAAARGLELTVFRVSETLRANGAHEAAFSALERWLVRRGWRGDIVKKLKYTSVDQVMPVRTFWRELGFEVVTWTPQWDEHVVKKWR